MKDEFLKKSLLYCVTYFDKKEAVDRIMKYIDDSLKLKEEEVLIKLNKKKEIMREAIKDCVDRYADNREEIEKALVLLEDL